MSRVERTGLPSLSWGWLNDTPEKKIARELRWAAEEAERQRLKRANAQKKRRLINILLVVLYLAFVAVVLLLAAGCGTAVEVICDYTIETECLIVDCEQPENGGQCFTPGEVVCGDSELLRCEWDTFLGRPPPHPMRWVVLLNCPGGCTTDPLVCH